mgnify:CR=1 FL=1
MYSYVPLTGWGEPVDRQYLVCANLLQKEISTERQRVLETFGRRQFGNGLGAVALQTTQILFQFFMRENLTNYFLNFGVLIPYPQH